MDSKIPRSLREVVAWQAYVVSRQQLLTAGVPRSTVISRVERGHWERLRPGAYRTVGGDVPWEAHLWAASLYAGAGALLSHETAANMLGLTARRHPEIQLVIPKSRRVLPQPGLLIRRSGFEYLRWRSMPGLPPCTFFTETVIDLVAAADNLDDAITWVSRGMTGRRIKADDLKVAAKARRPFRWGEQAEELIDAVAGGSHFPLEYRYDRDVAHAHGLPQATKQAKFQKGDGTTGFRDRAYEQYGLIVELDGKEFHDEEQRGRDQLRDNETVVTAGATLRYGWPAVTRTPCTTAAQVYLALRKRGYGGTLKPCSVTCRASEEAQRLAAPSPGKRT
jgi:hypothetical protein